MTEEELKLVRERLAALPPGGWWSEYDGDENIYVVTDKATDVSVAVMYQPYPLGAAVAVFVAHCKADVPALLAHVDDLRAELAELRAIVEGDLFTDSEPLRLAYERGLRAGAQKWLDATNVLTKSPEFVARLAESLKAAPPPAAGGAP